jgi:hypothetical protein
MSDTHRLSARFLRGQIHFNITAAVRDTQLAARAVEVNRATPHLAADFRSYVISRVRTHIARAKAYRAELERRT